MPTQGEPDLWPVAAAAALSLVLLPLSINCCVKTKAKLGGRRPGEPHYRSALWLAVYTLLIAAGWGLVVHLGGLAAASDATFDPFETLGVDEFAGTRDIKKAYRRLSMTHHPDKGGDQVTFQNIAKAYRALTDPVSKRNYALYGHPDGPQGMSAGVGLPTFMLDKENSNAMFAFYLSLLMGCPAFCYHCGLKKRVSPLVQHLVDAQKEVLVHLSGAMAREDSAEQLLATLCGAPCLLPGAGAAPPSVEEEAEATKEADAVAKQCLAAIDGKGGPAAAQAWRRALDDCGEEPLQRLNLALLLAHTHDRSISKAGERIEGPALSGLSPTSRARLALLLGAVRDPTEREHQLCRRTRSLSRFTHAAMLRERETERETETHTERGGREGGRARVTTCCWPVDDLDFPPVGRWRRRHSCSAPRCAWPRAGTGSAPSRRWSRSAKAWRRASGVAPTRRVPARRTSRRRRSHCSRLPRWLCLPARWRPPRRWRTKSR
jgi:hypothetical protein